MTTIRLGISTCPNDTFAFHALMNKLVDWRGLEFQIELLDIQQLNERLFAGDFDVAKASFHAGLSLADRMWVLPSGSALGFGVGPLLLSCQAGDEPCDASQLTLCPGEHTTASLLFSLFYPLSTRVKQVVFSEIMPKLQRLEANFGVCIHEGRFTWQQQGLFLVEDLGTRWERETQSPLPLGGILAAKSLGGDVLTRVQQTIRDSLLFALGDPGATLPTQRHYAQEFDDEVLMQHVNLYVNDWTLSLGPVGSSALQQLSQRAKAVGLISADAPNIEVAFFL
ncbi:MAG: 1,4-dihydroxy-6-naphthoate synthase [Pirellulaceae bacterium]|nr:1,4-dihydroxy-6-naphthoate synthase [Pirellulaceae bacterium]